MSADALHALALSDARIALLSADGAYFEEPGVALVDAGDEQRARFGFAAWRRARLRPRALRDRVWSGLDAHNIDAHNIALAYEQLSTLWRRVVEPDTPALLIVPAYYQERGALGVLLGIAEAAGIRVRAFVESPIAASTVRWPNVTRAHLEFDEHECVLTLLEHDGAVRKRACNVLANHGLRQVRAALFQQAKRALLASPARFDFSESAESEQAAHDALFPSSELAPVPVLNFSHMGRKHEVQLEARMQKAALEKFTDEVCAFVAREFLKEAPAQRTRTRLGIELGANAARVLGLQETLETKCGAIVRTLSSDAEFKGVLSRSKCFPTQEKVYLKNVLPWAGRSLQNSANDAKHPLVDSDCSDTEEEGGLEVGRAVDAVVTVIKSVLDDDDD